MRLLWLVPLVCLGLRAHAESAESNAVNRMVLKAKDEIRAQDEKQIRIVRSLQKLNENLRRQVMDRRKISSEQVNVIDAIAEQESRLEELSARVQALRQRFSKRLRKGERFNSASALGLIIGAEDRSRVDQHFRIMKMINRHDREALREYRKAIASIQSDKIRLLERQKHLAALEDALNEREKALREEQERKNHILAGIRRARIFTARSLERIRREHADMVSMDPSVLDAILSPSIGELRGSLPWPTAGIRLRDPGIVRSEDQHWKFHHNGVFLSTAPESAVQTVFGGRVVFSDRIDGFGQTVVIDHGDNYYSVYSNLSRVEVRTGASVEQGQRMAMTNYSPLENQHGLYFEIRHYSEPDDPIPWMKGQNL